MKLDTAFDMRSDTPEGADPDKASSTLRRYHKLLWSKDLPSGHRFDLDDSVSGTYLHHKSDLGEFRLASDTLVPTYANKVLVRQLPTEETNDFRTLQYTIGGFTIFPVNPTGTGRKQSINQARGLYPSISDRLDLTLECIRRHYADQPHPLAVVLSRHANFFSLFHDFAGYVNFFLFQDWVTDDLSEVRFVMPFEDFTTPAIPRDVPAYLEYRRLSVELIKARNDRIASLDL